jgi:hypothetical protein
VTRLCYLPFVFTASITGWSGLWSFGGRVLFFESEWTSENEERERALDINRWHHGATAYELYVPLFVTTHTNIKTGSTLLIRFTSCIPILRNIYTVV